MIFILELDQVPEFKEKFSKSTCSYRRINLYDRTVYFTWGGKLEKTGNVTSINSNGKAILSTRSWKNEDTVLNVDGIPIGGREIVVAAGPCSVESNEQLLETAKQVKNAGASILRGGVFKPRTSPYSFQGLGEKGIQILLDAREELRMPIVTEMLDEKSARKFSDNVDIVQVGSRNGQNFPLLNYLGKAGKPVLLKNGMGNNVEEWINASEYILSNGNGNVILCYRGARSFESGLRFSMDIGSIAVAKHITHLPVGADPSHPAGKEIFVENLALGAIAAGADMLEIEVHIDPDNALSDREQQQTPLQFSRLMKKVEKLSEAIGRRIWKG